MYLIYLPIQVHFIRWILHFSQFIHIVLPKTFLTGGKWATDQLLTGIGTENTFCISTSAIVPIRIIIVLVKILSPANRQLAYFAHKSTYDLENTCRFCNMFLSNQRAQLSREKLSSFRKLREVLNFRPVVPAHRSCGYTHSNQHIVSQTQPHIWIAI